MSRLTLIEKIATSHTAPGCLKAGEVARSGDIITIRPKHVMTHDNSSAVMGKFATIFKSSETFQSGGTGVSPVIHQPKIYNPKQPVFAIDHDIQNHSPDNLAKYARIEAFAKEHGIDFYPPGTGISHQVMVEYGYATPGAMVVGSDSHSNLYGAVGALGTPVVRTDAACIWATGQTWWQVPRVAKVNLHGQLQRGVVGKDVIIALCGLFNNDEVLNHAVEFGGDGIAQLSMDQRMSIANMTTEWGALAGVFPFDETLRGYLHDRADFLASLQERTITRDGHSIDAKPPTHKPRLTHDEVDAMFAVRLTSDIDASYAIELSLDLSTVVPHVSGPDHVKVMHSLPEIEKRQVKIHKAYLLSCVNARLEDLHEAATIVEGKQIADGVEFYVAAASANVQQQAEDNGTWQKLLAAGAIELPPGCGTCIGLGRGTLEPGEVAISATNRNFKGRMGSRDAEAYLASPAVVAASALRGYICSPHNFESTEPVFTIDVKKKQNAAASSSSVEIIDGFPESITGRLTYLPIDNLNTDGIYSGKLTYRDDVSPSEMAAASFANYDPEFSAKARPGDIVVAGANFGTGSSREQAATCLQKFGIPCVIAESFSETYKRNAFNNGFVVFECPELIEALHKQFASRESEKTIFGSDLTIDFAHSQVILEGKTYSFAPLSPTAQELIVAGGAENLVRQRLAQ